MIKIKKFLLILIIPFIFTGCVKNNTVELSFASWGSATEVKIIKDIIRDYEKNTPGVKINFMHIPQNYFQKIHILFASNTSPDIIFINNLYLPVYEKHLEDLAAITDKKEFYPQTIEGLTYENRLLAIPRDISELVFYVNLDKAKLPDSGWRLEDIITYKTNAKYTVSYEDDIYWLNPYLAYFGGGVLNERFEPVIDSEKSVQAVNFYKNLKNKYHIAPTQSQVGSSTLAQMFLKQEIAFYLSGRWMFPKISETADFNWAVINFPYGVLPQQADVSGWAISKTSKHKKEATDFVKYISGEQSAEYFAKTGLIVPARIQASKLLNNSKHNEKTFLEIINYSESKPVSKNYKKLTDKMNSELDL